ncbi:MAG: aldose 1-epimerase family protein [Ruminococcaceae bacterium]|nr:aldose 1-epimerase family protein [Oscillospiraceae bacterium]
MIMIYNIENKDFSLSVKEMGAELNSFKSKKTGFEFIWEGNTDIWYGQSPILFPIIGRLLDDKYRLNGEEYTMPKHGIVRKKPFKLIDKTENTLKFIQSDDENSLKEYPYHFDLIVEFKITDNGLSVTHTVVNKNDCVMYFSFGAHPAFNCEIGDYLEFSEKEELLTERIDHDSILIEEKFPVNIDGNKLTITKNLFDDDALILSGYKSKAISLKSNNHNRVVKFNFDSPLLGIWAKPGAPYVCIEPWWGVNDNYDKKDDLSQKRGIMELPPLEEKSFNWNIEICE